MNHGSQLGLAVAASELASLLDYVGQVGEAKSVREEATTLAMGRGEMHTERLRAGVDLLQRVKLSFEDRVRAEAVAQRLEKAIANGRS